MDKKEARWEIVVNHLADILTEDMILRGIQSHCEMKQFGMPFDYPLMRYEQDNGDISYPAWQIRTIEQAELPLKTFQKLVRILKISVKAYTRYLKRFKQNIRKGAITPKIIEEYFRKTMIFAGTIPYFAFERSLHREMSKRNISIKEIQPQTTDTTRASHYLARWAKQHKKQIQMHKHGAELPLALQKKLKAFCQRFGYLGMKYYKGKPWTIEEAYAMLTHATESKGESRTKPMGKRSPYLHIAEGLLHLRTIKWELMCQGTYLFREAIIKNYKGIITYDDLLWCIVPEVINAVNHETAAPNHLERETAVIEIQENKVILFLKEKKPTMPIQEIPTSQLTGICAFPGKVVGKVKVILTPVESSKLEKGEILVATMSTPDFLPAMARAAAFVTDIGGITSHAAIVAREMRKPCVIGTKIATKVLRDGDLVEVDAEKGIVRKLK